MSRVTDRADVSRVYLDWNASAPLLPEAAEAMAVAGALANPSSVHAEGRRARGAVERARAQVAALVNAAPEQIVFTSGATEASATALHGLGNGEARPELLLTAGIEHASVLNGHGFPHDAVQVLSVGSSGAVDLTSLEDALAKAGSRRVLLALQLANGETGVVQPLRDAAGLVRAAGGLVYSDAVQALGKMPVDCEKLGADALGLSAHKIGGPKGVGALVLGPGVRLASPLLGGGGQERGQRGGTENVPGIVGFGVAAEIAMRRLPEMAGVVARRDRLERGIRELAPDAVIFGAGAPRLPNTVAFATPGLRAEIELIAFDLAGVALSSGSACSSGKVRRSAVLDSMAVAPDLAEGALRVSIGRDTTEVEVERFLAVLRGRVAQRMRKAA